MKVLQVLPALQGGGVETGTLEIAQALVTAGHESWVLSAGGRLVEPLVQNGSHHKHWDIGKKSLFTLRHVYKLRRWLAAERFDIVHVRSRMPAWITYLAWRQLPKSQRPRLVSTVHGLHSVNKYSAIMGCGERVIVVSETARHYILDNYPQIAPAKLTLIYRGVDPQHYPRGFTPSQEWLSRWHQQFPQLVSGVSTESVDQSSSQPSSRTFSNQPFIVTLPGRITRLKGHLGFINIIEQLHRQGLPVQGLIVGGDDPKRMNYRNAIDEAIQQRGLSSLITFTGHRSDMREIYSQSNAVVSLSTKPESFGRTVLEALSIGTPVIGYAHGGVGEILDALYPYGAIAVNDEAGVSAALAQLHSGNTPTINTNQQFLLEHMQTQTLSLYSDLCERPSL